MTKNTRMCVACRERYDKRALLRVSKRSDGSITLDITGKVDGRGAYVCKTRECIELAVKKRGFNKAYSQNIGANIYDELRKYIESKDVSRLRNKGE